MNCCWYCCDIYYGANVRRATLFYRRLQALCIYLAIVVGGFYRYMLKFRPFHPCIVTLICLMLASFVASTAALSPPPSSPRSPSPPCDCHDWENSSSFADADGAPVKVKACCETCSAFVKEGACATARYNDTLEAFNPWVFCKRTGQEFLPPWARDPNHPGWGRGSRGGRGGGRGRPPLQNVTLGRHHGVVGEGGSCKEKANSHQTLTWVLALSVALGMLIAAVVLLVLCYRRFSRDRANLRTSRDRANMDLQMISHQVQIRVHTLADDSASLPSCKSMAASMVEGSLPPGPPSSSNSRRSGESDASGTCVAEQEKVPAPMAVPATSWVVPTTWAVPATWAEWNDSWVANRFGAAANSGVAPTAPAPLEAPTVGPSPSLRRTKPKRPAPEPRAKTFTSPCN